MKSNLFTIFLFIIISIASCRKVQDNLPSETAVGAYTIGFKVNGTVYTANGKVGQLLNDGSVSYNYSNYTTDHSIFIRARRNAGDNKFEIWLAIPYKDTIGTYLLMNDYKGTFFLGGNPNPNDQSGASIYTTNNVYTGKVNISYFDGTPVPYYPGRILAGTFEMKGVNKNGKVIQITDGRFDIGN